MCLRLSAWGILLLYASILTNLVSADKIRHVFMPSYHSRYAWSYWLFVASFSENAKYLEARNSVVGDPGESCWRCWQSDVWNDWDRDRCQTEAPLSWKKPPVVLRAIKLYFAWTLMITKPISQTWPIANSAWNIHISISTELFHWTLS